MSNYLNPLTTYGTMLKMGSLTAPALAIDEPASKQMHDYSQRLGLPLACVAIPSGTVLGVTDPKALPIGLPEPVAQRLLNSRSYSIIDELAYATFFSLPLSPVQGQAVVAVGMTAVPNCPIPESVRMRACAVEGVGEFDGIYMTSAEAENLPAISRPLLPNLLQSTIDNSHVDRQQRSLRKEVENLAAELDYSYEEVNLLHALTSHLQISRAPRELAELVLQRLPELIPSEGQALWIDDGHGQLEFLSRGKFPLSELDMAQLLARFDHHDWSRALIRNHIQGSLLGEDFATLRNFVVVSVGEGTHRAGWLCCANMNANCDFGTVEGRLLGSVASILGTHNRNIELYRQHEELMLCFVRSLVSSLDAKDSYTRGHSERVALIARRLGAELQLPEEDLKNIYLSGLLHDIGKIGINDSILQKPGDLTNDEFEEIKKHPVIGYNILLGVRNLQPVLPGVRHHHEAYNGRGYPDKLAGEQIPLMARILAVADSYDAMGSDRPYRAGRPLEDVEAILRDGSGSQWDPRVVQAYFQARADIQRLWKGYSAKTDGALRSDWHESPELWVHSRR